MYIIFCLTLEDTKNVQTLMLHWHTECTLNVWTKGFFRDVHQHGNIVSMVLFGSKCIFPIILYISIKEQDVSLLYLISYINQRMLDLYIKHTCFETD